jgi:hypothetical protein
MVEIGINAESEFLSSAPQREEVGRGSAETMIKAEMTMGEFRQ